jgi:hypothetical protein
MRAMSFAPEVLDYYVAVFRDLEQPAETRLKAGAMILDRAMGKPKVVEEITGGTADQVRHIYEIRWLPPEAPEHRTIEGQKPVEGQ